MPSLGLSVDPIRSDPKMPGATFFSALFFLSSITDFLLSAILLALFFFVLCPRNCHNEERFLVSGFCGHGIFKIMADFGCEDSDTDSGSDSEETRPI